MFCQPEGLDMTIKNLKNKIGATVLGFFLLIGISVSLGTSAQAQYPQYPTDRGRQDRRDRDDRSRRGRNDDGYGNYGGSFQLRQTALNAGFNEGLKEGRNDFRRNRRHDVNSFGAYRSATQDYNSREGDRSIYQRYFREAFQNGYLAGLRGN
jgi:hypothetical protein